ncbi:MAG: hypothetical protein ACRC2Y_04910 [Aeromonas veronii]
MKAITLKLNEITITLHTHDGNHYRAQDLLTGYGMSSEEASDTIRNWIRSIESKMNRNLAEGNKTRQIDVISVRGRNGGTYLTEHQIYNLAGYVDYDFEVSVYEAFRNLVNGNTEEAERLALSVANVHDVMTTRNKKKAIDALFAAQKKNVYVFSKEFLALMDNNTSADQSDRLKTTNRLLDLISAHEDKAFHDKKQTGNLDIARITVCQAAKALVLEYISAKSRQSLGHQLTRQRNKVIKLQAANDELHNTVEAFEALLSMKAA